MPIGGRTGVLDSAERQIPPAALGYPLTAHITIQVPQRLLDDVAAALAAIPEVLQVVGISGQMDLDPPESLEALKPVRIQRALSSLLVTDWSRSGRRLVCRPEQATSPR